MANIFGKLVAATFLGTTLAAVVNANPAFAIRFNFFSDFTAEPQINFPGGSLIGTLAGEDVNMDEILESTEITNFFARFESNDEGVFPSFTQEGRDVIAGSISKFGFGSQSGNYEFATFTSTYDSEVFGPIDVLFGGDSGFNSISVNCVVPENCSSPPFRGGSFGIDQQQGITLVPVPEPSTIAALAGVVVLGLGGLVKKRKLPSAEFNGSLLK